MIEEGPFDMLRPNLAPAQAPQTQTLRPASSGGETTAMAEDSLSDTPQKYAISHVHSQLSMQRALLPIQHHPAHGGRFWRKVLAEGVFEYLLICDLSGHFADSLRNLFH